MNSTRQVEIISCSKPDYWYAAFVGQIFCVEKESFTDDDRLIKYVVVPPPGTDPLYLINIDDCKPV